MSLQPHSAWKVVIDSGARGSRRAGSLAGRVGRAEPVAGDDAEVAAAAAGVRPPQIAMRVGRLAGRDDAARPTVRSSTVTTSTAYR